MKILHVITRLIIGGAQQNTILSCSAQVGAGHRVWLAFGPVYGPEGSLAEQALESGAELVTIRSMRRSVLPLHDLHSYGAVGWLIRKVRPDVVHTHSSKAGIVGRAAGWHHHVPAVVHTIHGLPFHERQNPLVYGTYVNAERWAGRRCHRLIGITQAMCDAFRRHRIGRPDQFEVAPSGIDVSRFELPSPPREVTRRAYGIPPDAAVVGVVARLDHLKGHEDLLHILPELVRCRRDLRLLFVGDGYHRQALERRVAIGGFQDRVIFAGLVPPVQVPSLYGAMDIMALPSYQEGQGRTLVEALLCGCAIVGYDSGGIGEVCIDGRTGRLVPTGDKAALAVALIDLLENEDQRRRLARQGRDHALQRFNHHTMVRRLEEIYEKVLGEMS